MPPMSFVKPGTEQAAAADAAKAVTETIVTPTPVAGVVVESVNTVGVTGAVGSPGNPGTSAVLVDTQPAPGVITQVAQVSQALVTKPAMQVSTNSFGVDDFLPDFGDIIWPRINFAQNIGELKDSFIPGSIVLAQETLLYRPPVLKDGAVKEQGTVPVRFTILGFRKTRFAEYVPGGGKGIIVKTEAEVRANGGTTSYDEHKLKAKDGMKKFDPLAEALVAIEKPDSMADDDTVFVYGVEGRKYALALWSMKRMSYTNGAKVLFTKRAMGVLSKGYPTYSFGVSSKWKSVGETNGSFIPVFSEPIKHTPEFLAWAEQVKNPSAAESTGGEE